MRQPDILDRCLMIVARLCPYLVGAVLLLALAGMLSAQDMMRVVRGGWRREEAAPAGPTNIPYFEDTLLWLRHEDSSDPYADSSFVATNLFSFSTKQPFYVSPQSGVYYGQYNNDAGHLYARYVQMTATNLLTGLTEFSLSVWVCEMYHEAYASFLAARGSYSYAGIGKHSASNAIMLRASEVTLSMVTNPIGNHAYTWVNYVGTFEGGKCAKIYRDGELVASNAVTLASATNMYGAFRMANDSYHSSRTFSGYVDDACIWSKALSSNDAYLVYTLGHGGATPPKSTLQTSSGDWGGGYPYSNNTVVFYPFDVFTNTAGKFVDASAIGTNTATPRTGGEMPTYVSPDQGIYLNGADYATLDTNPFLGMTQYTLSVWYNISNFVQYAGIFYMRGQGTGDLHVAGVSCSSSSGSINYGYDCILDPFRHILVTATQEWVNCAYVWNGGYCGTNLFFYLNGELVASKIAPYHTLQIYGDYFKIGYDDGDSSRKLDGFVDNICVWDIALPSNAVKAVKDWGH
jgi:hypothetical protein